MDPAASCVTPAGAAAVGAVLALPRAVVPIGSSAAVGKALFALGCAAAALAIFGMTLNPADSAGFLGPCAPTEEAAADLRSASKHLLLAAAAQVFGATLAVVAPSPASAVFAAGLGATTALRLSYFFPALLMCHLDDARTIASYVLFLAVMWITLVVSVVAAAIGGL